MEQDQSADWILLIKGLDQHAVAEAYHSLDDPSQYGATPGHDRAMYRLQAVLAASDLSEASTLG